MPGSQSTARSPPPGRRCGRPLSARRPAWPRRRSPPCSPPGRAPPGPLIRAWMPQRATRFCPACLAEDPAQIPAAWSLPVTFFCLRHDQAPGRPLPALRAPARPAALARPGRALLRRPGRVRQPLGAASPPRCDGPRAARRRRKPSARLLAGVRDPAGTAASRRRALGQLTDIALIAYHLAASGNPGSGRQASPRHARRRHADRGVRAARRPPDGSGQRPAGQPGHRVPPGHRTAGHPVDPGARPARRWPPGSPAPATRGCAPPTGSGTRPRCRPARARTAPVPVLLTWPPPARPGCPTSSGRTGRSASPATPPPPPRKIPARRADRTAAPAQQHAAHQVTAMVSGQLRRHVAGYQLSKLTDPALRMLTELAFAIDDHGIPIDYRRRRDLAAGTILIDDETWARMTRAGGDAAGPAPPRPPLPLRAAHRLRPGHRPGPLPARRRISRAATATSSSASPPAWPPRWPATPAACSTAGGSATSRCNGSRPMTG